MKNEEKVTRKRMFSEEQKADLFKEQEPLLTKKNIHKNEEEILIRVQFKANLETQYLLNCLCKKKKQNRDRLITELILQEAKKENISISVQF
jgi:hypothetical protein